MTLASAPDRSIAFLRDVVGYGRLPGETSRIESLAGLSVVERATVLAWYWPQRGYREGFDPFAEFAAVSRSRDGERIAQLQLRTLAASRFEGFIRSASTAGGRLPDEVVGAMCWRSTCSGDRLIGVLEGAHGLTFDQFLNATRAVGLQYIDPLDGASVVSSWTSAAAEMGVAAQELLVTPVEQAMALARSALGNTATDAPPRWLQPTERPFDLASVRSALEDRERLADRSRIGQVVADLVVGPESPDHALAVELLANLLTGISNDQFQLLTDRLQLAARYLDTLPIGLGNVDQGFGWLLMDRAKLAERVDEALEELASVSATRATIRKRFNWGEDRSPIPRPGDTYTAPAPGTRYRSLYEALATITVQAPAFEIDTKALRMRTPTAWVDLPPSAVRDRAWWSGSGRSVTGRPQVRAWWAAGFGTPKLATNDDGLVALVQFPSLPGREDWLRKNPVEERLARGRYIVPPARNTPYHAALTYDGPSVWHMDNEQIRSLRTSLTGASPVVAAQRSGEDNEEATSEVGRSDAEQIDLLVTHLRQQGESSRRGIETLFATEMASLSDDLDMAKWLPNILAKARRQGLIANIGTRKQPRWVAAGSSAHLAARLSKVLGQGEHGNQSTKVTPPKLAPGEPVPEYLYRDAIHHVFPNLTPEPLPLETPAVRQWHDQPFLTDAGMSAVLAGRSLSNKGIEALLTTIDLKREADSDAAASVAGAFDGEVSPLDEDAILALLE